MDRSQKVYRTLQQHLHRQPVGFPATRSGAEIKILKHIFTPEEAEIAAHLSYRPEPLQTIFDRVGHRVGSAGELEAILERIAKKGGIEFKRKSGRKYYACAPLVVGMYELQLDRLTPEFIRDFNEYISDKRFGIEFLSTELPQMRTIPVSRSIRPRLQVNTFDEAAALLQTAAAPVAVLECICRKTRTLGGRSCRLTRRRETCLAMGDVAAMVLENGKGRRIDRQTALAIVEENQKDGLVLQPSNTQNADFICSCCGCCCGMLGFHKSLPRPLDFWASNYYAVADNRACIGCGTCEERCQVGAVTVDPNNRRVAIDLNRCLGCGLCVPECPAAALSLAKKPIEQEPPPTREDLYDRIMAGKKGSLGKLALTGKLLVDALRTGQIHRLRS